MDDFTEKAEKTAVKYSMFESASKIAVCLSGGKDSVALLGFMLEMSHKYGFELEAWHVNHGIRGKDADDDELFAKKLCEKLGVSFRSEKVDCPAYAKEKGLGLEQAARELRYGCFEKWSKEQNISRIATAHTASDNLETVLFNLARGTGIKGLCGIPPVRDKFIRPLLGCTSEEVIGYCKQNGLDFVYDKTNGDTAYSRNRIRSLVVPELKKINPSVEKCAEEMTEILRLEDGMLNDMADDPDYKKADVYRTLQKAVRYRVLRKIYSETCPHGSLSYDNTVISDEFIMDKKASDKYLCLPPSLVFRIKKGTITFETKKQDVTIPEKIPASKGLNIFGDSAIFIGNCEEIPEEYKNIYKIDTSACIKESLITDTMFIRAPQTGDKYRQGKMTKTLRKMLNAKKLPLDERAVLPLVCNENGIIWVPYFRPSDTSVPNSNENKINICFLHKTGERS